MDARGRFLGPHLAEALADLPLSNVLDVGGRSGIYLYWLSSYHFPDALQHRDL